MRTLSLALLAGCILPLASCDGRPGQSKQDVKLTVFAAASLREAFTTISDDFKRAHPGTEVTLNFAGTQELRTQLEHGASADVFASADQRHMDALVQAKMVADGRIFARNEPVVVVAKEKASLVRTFFELPRVDRIVIGTPEVPIGRYSLQILDRAGTKAGTKAGTSFRAQVEAKVVSRELNVRQVLAKVALGEADAGIVYRTDALTVRDQVHIVPIPPEINVIAEYPIGVVAASRQRERAQAWVNVVLAPEGQRALQVAGFLAPAKSD